jgi:hypothetical protein
MRLVAQRGRVLLVLQTQATVVVVLQPMAQPALLVDRAL